MLLVVKLTVTGNCKKPIFLGKPLGQLKEELIKDNSVDSLQGWETGNNSQCNKKIE